MLGFIFSTTVHGYHKACHRLQAFPLTDYIFPVNCSEFDILILFCNIYLVGERMEILYLLHLVDFGRRYYKS